MSKDQEINDLKAKVRKLTFLLEERNGGSVPKDELLLDFYDRQYQRQINQSKVFLEAEYLIEQKLRAKAEHMLLRDQTGLSQKEKDLAKRKTKFAEEVNQKAEVLASKTVGEKFVHERRSIEKTLTSLKLDEKFLRAKHQRAMEELNNQKAWLDDQKKAFEAEQKKLNKQNASARMGIEKREKELEKEYSQSKAQLGKKEIQIQRQVEKLREKNASLRSQIDVLKVGSPSARKLKSQNKLLEKEIGDLKNSHIPQADFEDLVDWVVANRPAQSGLFGTRLITIGSKPFKTEWFDQQLRRLGFEVFSPSPGENDVPYVIVGRANWQEDLKLVIESEFDEGPYVLTQEAFLISHCLSEDPFPLYSDDWLWSLSADHPAINHLESIGFNWRGEFGDLFEDSVDKGLSQDTLDYLVSHADWDFLPPGQWGMSQIEAHFEENRAVIESQTGQVVDIERLSEIGALNPSAAIIGKRGWLGYVTFCFNFTDKVVLECPVEGNAIYICMKPIGLG